jgi:hypothetical protein
VDERLLGRQHYAWEDDCSPTELARQKAKRRVVGDAEASFIGEARLAAADFILTPKENVNVVKDERAN